MLTISLPMADGGECISISLLIADGGVVISELLLLQAVSDNTNDIINAEVKNLFMIAPSLLNLVWLVALLSVSHNAEISVVLAPHGCGAIISISPDFMSYNARQLGAVAD